MGALLPLMGHCENVYLAVVVLVVYAYGILRFVYAARTMVMGMFS